MGNIVTNIVSKLRIQELEEDGVKFTLGVVVCERYGSIQNTGGDRVVLRVPRGGNDGVLCSRCTLKRAAVAFSGTYSPSRRFYCCAKHCVSLFICQARSLRE